MAAAYGLQLYDCKPSFKKSIHGNRNVGSLHILNISYKMSRGPLFRQCNPQHLVHVILVLKWPWKQLCILRIFSHQGYSVEARCHSKSGVQRRPGVANFWVNLIINGSPQISQAHVRWPLLGNKILTLQSKNKFRDVQSTKKSMFIESRILCM